MEEKCSNCKNGVWCPTWGEWKCLVLLRRNAYEPDGWSSCEHYAKKTAIEEPKCHCDDCMSQVPEDQHGF